MSRGHRDYRDCTYPVSETKVIDFSHGRRRVHRQPWGVMRVYFLAQRSKDRIPWGTQLIYARGFSVQNE